MPRTDTFFTVTRKGQFFLAALLIMQTALLVLVFLRLEGGSSQQSIHDRIEPCIHPYSVERDRLRQHDDCLPHPTRVSGRA